MDNLLDYEKETGTDLYIPVVSLGIAATTSQLACSSAYFLCGSQPNAWSIFQNCQFYHFTLLFQKPFVPREQTKESPA